MMNMFNGKCVKQMTAGQSESTCVDVCGCCSKAKHLQRSACCFFGRNKKVKTPVPISTNAFDNWQTYVSPRRSNTGFCRMQQQISANWRSSGTIWHHLKGNRLCMRRSAKIPSKHHAAAKLSTRMTQRLFFQVSLLCLACLFCGRMCVGFHRKKKEKKNSLWAFKQSFALLDVSKSTAE